MEVLGEYVVFFDSAVVLEDFSSVVQRVKLLLQSISFCLVDVVDCISGNSFEPLVDALFLVRCTVEVRSDLVWHLFLRDSL